MPFALVTIGLLFIITGFQDTYKEFFSEVEGDFTGNDSFIYWLISLGVVGSLGYVPELKTFSRATMALIVIGMVIANKGVFANFNQAVQQGSSTPVDAPGAALPSDSSSTGSTGNGGGGILGSLGSLGGSGGDSGSSDPLDSLFGGASDDGSDSGDALSSIF